MRNSPSTTGNRPDSSSNASGRRFGTTDLAVVLALWGAMAVMLGGVLSDLFSDMDTPMAKAQSEAYAQQLVLSGLRDQRDTQMRGPASVAPETLPSDKELRSGKLGRDPWGKPYQYRILSSAVVVWSTGRNHETESETAVDRLEEGHSPAEFVFMGDDVGSIQFRHKENAYRQ